MTDSSPVELERFAALVVARRYDLAIQTLRIVLARGFDSAAREMLRAVCGDCLRSVPGIAVAEKLEMLEFFHWCFELAHDVEEQFVLRYENLMLRETFCIRYPELVVSAEEWMAFARECSGKYFFSNAVKAYDMAIKHMKSIEDKKQAMAERELAFTSAKGTSAVQAQGLQVLKRKEISNTNTETKSTETSSGAAQYLSAIKRLNLRKLEGLRARNSSLQEQKMVTSLARNHL